MAAQPPVSFATTEPLATTCTKLAFKGTKVVVRNETGSQRKVRLVPVEFSNSGGKAIATKKVCGGIWVEPRLLKLGGGASRKLMLRAAAARAGDFSGSLVLFGRKGRVSRRAVTVSAKPVAKTKGLNAVPLVESQSVELKGSKRGPIWVPVEGTEQDLPAIDTSESAKSVTVGAVSGPGGTVPVNYVERKFLNSSTSAAGLELAGDLDPGTYSGTVDLDSVDKEKGSVSLEVKIAECWWVAAILIAVGIGAGLVLQRWAGRKIPKGRLEGRVNDLGDRHGKAVKELREKAGLAEKGATNDGKKWGCFEIKDLDDLKKGLREPLADAAKHAVIQIDKKALESVEAAIAVVEAQIDLLKEVPAHAEDLESQLELLTGQPPAGLPERQDDDANEEAPSLDTAAREALQGTKVKASELKARIEEIDNRAKQVRTLRQLEDRLADLWQERSRLDPVGNDKVAPVEAKLRAIRHLLWNAEGAEDLATGAAEIQDAAKKVAELWSELPDPLPVRVARNLYAAGGLGVQAIYRIDEREDFLGSEGSLSEGAVLTLGLRAEEPSAQLPSLTASPPDPKLTGRDAERQVRSAVRAQICVVIVAAIVAVATGLSAVYASNDTWGSSWDWLVAATWGLVVQATVTTLANSLDGLGALGWMRRG